jgi:spore coat polysaccharide biosynthesis predicted glycosyltransferase SpsG
MPKSTLIITRADAAFGHGHLTRSLTLAAALRGEGAKVEVLLLGDEGALQHARARKEPVNFFPSWELRYAMRRSMLSQLLCGLYQGKRPQLAVFDMYDFADTYWARRFFSELFTETAFVGLDIYKRREGEERPEREAYKPVAFSLIINSLLAPFGSHETEVGGVRALCGTGYLILPPELTKAPKWREGSADAPVPVMLGASIRDPHDLAQIKPTTLRAVHALNEITERRFAMLSAYPDALAPLCRENVKPTRLLTPAKFYEMLAASQCAIVSAGVTLYEAAHLGVPVAIIPAAAHEQVTARKFIDAGYGIQVNVRGDVASQLRGALSTIALPEFAQSQSAAGRRLVDGKGLERVLAVLRETMRP